MKPDSPLSIEVDTQFIPEQSDDDRFLFLYHISITNQCEQTLVLQRRHWVITDGNGEETEVEGAGVVGETPTLQPGGSFEYTSSMTLPTPLGSMTGSYILSSNRGLIKARIPRFSLSIPGVLH